MSEPPPDLLAAAFRAAFRRHPAGVIVITCDSAEGVAVGMTATSVCSVSARPPQVLACIDHRSRTLTAILGRRRFAVNMLAVEQRAISEGCARPDADKSLLADVTMRPEGGVPILRDATASLTCTLVAAHEAVSHLICVGRVERVHLGRVDAPLVYADGAYHTTTPLGPAHLDGDSLLNDLLRAYW